jgi:secreted PhoX family phosphatase
MENSNRRAFLRKTTTVAGAVALAGPFQGLLARAGGVVAGNSGVNNKAGYGPLVDAMDRTTGQYLLQLPEGFEYRTFGEAGSMMEDGAITPPSHDGMMAFKGPNGSLRLVRNHETTYQDGNTGGLFGGDVPQPPAGEVAARPYDGACNGGTTTIEIGRDDGDWGPVRSWRSASGTYFNCSGGNTSYGTWITCEELPSGPDMSGPPWGGDFFGNSTGLMQKHGYIYEVDPAWGPDESPVPVPIRSAGRFTHEGAVMDNATGYLYMTQDDFFGPSGLYRYIPPAGNKPQRDRALHDGGVLQMLRVPGIPNAELFNHQEPGASYAVDWVTIDDPDPDYDPGSSWFASLGVVSAQGIAQGAAQFSRLEGIRRRGRQIFFSSTQGGQGREGASSTFGPGYGQIWQLNLASMRLQLVFEAPPTAPGQVGPEDNLPALSLPDNIAISPRGVLVLCEDGTIDDPPFVIPSNFMRGLTKGGELFDFAKNIDTTGEFTGATFSPDGKRMFFNIQDIGRTFEVRGPFERGPF